MNPGLVVKLRPAGPWRIGPDSGARNRVDAIYHSDSLYSAVTSAMSRMGSLAAWLDATARSQTPAVCFSSCYPFLDDMGFVVPPRTIWPPTSPAAMSARVRWKSARFIALSLVESILAGKRLNENQWSVDGPSGCLVPAGKPGPFRTSVRWNAAVDRLSGASERYSTACIEFREGCGLWTVAGFRDDAARDEWQEPVKAAFRLLADSGFGGERSRGWGRAETPEFVEGTLPGLIVEYRRREPAPAIEEPPVEEPPMTGPPITEPPPAEEPVPEREPPVEPAAAPVLEAAAPIGAATVRERSPAALETEPAEPVPAPETQPVPETPATVPVPVAAPAPETPATVPVPVAAPAPAAEAEAPLVGQAGYPLGPPANTHAEPAPETVPPADAAPEAEAAAPETVPVAEAATPIGAATVRERSPAALETEPAEPAPVSEAAAPETEPAAPEPAPAVAAEGPETVPPAEPAPAMEALAPETLPPAEAKPVPEAEGPETVPPAVPAPTPEAAPETVPPAEPKPVPEAEGPETEPAAEPAPAMEALAPETLPPAEPKPVPEAAAPETSSPAAPAAELVTEPALSDAPIAAAVRAPDLTEPMRVAPERAAAPAVPAPAVHLQAHWLLSLFTPAAADAVDWGRGSYTVLARGGRIDSPSPGSGDLKKQIQMVAEGSVLYVDGVPLGAAADVAPDGFAHPVFRAGFALAIPLPEVH